MHKLSNLLIGFLLSLISCVPTHSYYNWTSPEYSYRAFDKIAVFGLSKDLQDASDFEVSMVTRLRKLGYKAVQGMSVIPPELRKDLDIKTARAHLLSKGIDAAISLAAVDIENRLVYVSGSSYAVPYERARFGTYFVTTYREIYTPGYYKQANSFIYESFCYDLTVENPDSNLIWAFQYKWDQEVEDLPVLANFSSQLIPALQRDRILLPN